MKRAKLKNDEDESNNVRVCVRVRPLLGPELERGDGIATSVLGDMRTVKISVPVDGRRRVETQHLTFDKSFAPEASQREVFHQSGVEAFCEGAIEGYAATVFCFGQTGSGKTFTMSGPCDGDTEADSESLGMQYRAAHFISNRVGALQAAGEIVVSMRASYIEIYNEAVNDLLNETQNLKVRWSAKAQSFFVEELMIVTCDDVSDILAVLEEGQKNRHRASHKLNHDSSRSHVIFTMYFDTRPATGGPPRLGKINFVDLAGSEKLKDSESTGSNAQETKSINKSLFALGNVISCLAAKGDVFVPYRDSTLTKLLQDSLGGSCRTLMVACVTPSAAYVEESMRTLKYALRTQNIVNSILTVRMDPKQQQLYELKVEVDMLRKDNAMLRGKLDQHGIEIGPSSSSAAPTPVMGLKGPPMGFGGNKMLSPSFPPTPTSLNSSSPKPPLPRLKPMVDVPMMPSPGGRPAPLDAQQLATVELAEKFKSDNERLREEVAQLRNMILQLKSASPKRGGSNAPTPSKAQQQQQQQKQQVALFLQQQQQPRQAFGGAPSVASSMPRTDDTPREVDDGNDDDDDGDARPPPAKPAPPVNPELAQAAFGFRPAPKKSQRLSLLPIASANGTVTSVASAPTAMRDPFGGTNRSIASNPVGAPRQDIEAEMARMRAELDRAQREIMRMRQHSAGGASMMDELGEVERY